MGLSSGGEGSWGNWVQGLPVALTLSFHQSPGGVFRSGDAAKLGSLGKERRHQALGSLGKSWVIEELGDD